VRAPRADPDGVGRFPRQGSGYALEHLLPERGFQVAKAFAGNEGTLGLLLSATVRLVREPAIRRLIVFGYPTMPDAADAVPAVLVYRPTACEDMDSRILEQVRRMGGAVPRCREVTVGCSSKSAAMTRRK